MKKNTKKIATLLLVAVVAVGSYLVSGTYAKYTSTITGGGTGTVAKWAWTIGESDIESSTDVTNGFTLDLFGNVLDTYDDNAETDVYQTTGAERLAPGTYGQVNIGITNNSEVNAKYTMSFTVTNTESVPLVYSLDGTNWVSDITTLSITTPTTINMGATSSNTTLYWKWVFSTDASGDAADTALGFAANTTAPTVTVNASVTVTQAD